MSNGSPDNQPRPTPGWPLRWLASVAVFCWPFICLFPYVFPAGQKYLAIGNDFHILYYWYKVYLLDALSHWTIPLWSPSEAAGFPFYSNPFTQTFYVLNIPLAVFYRLAGGYGVLDHQRFAVLGIAIFSLGLFRWLGSLSLGMRSALYATLVMSVSFKVTEILRFPNALHTAAWYPWVLYFMTRIARSESTNARVNNGALLTVAFICMLTGGYLYYVYYSPWLFGPYLAILLVPRWSAALLGRRPANLKGTLVTLATVGAVTAAISGPYLYKIGVLMQQTTDRTGQSFEYSTAHVFNSEDTIGSWVFPPASQMEGWYYFGMVNVLLIFLYLVGQRHPLKLVFLGWAGVITYITYGQSSYLFALLWHNVPMFSSLRVWGRMNIILVPILAWMLAAAYQHFELLLYETRQALPVRHRLENVRSLAALATIFAAILAVQVYFWTGGRYDYYWTNYYAGGIHRQGVSAALLEYLKALGIPSSLSPQILVAYAERAAIACGSIGFVVLSALLVLAPRFGNTGPGLRAGVLSGVLLLGVLDMWIVGPWAWAFTVYPTTQRTPINVPLRNAESLGTPRADAAGLSMTSAFNVGLMQNWYFKRYVDFLSRHSQERDAVRELLGQGDGRRVLFSEAIDHVTVRAFLADVGRFTVLERVRPYTGDELEVRIRAPTDGYLSFIDNWDADWEASVDGEPVSIERLFGTFKSVPVRAGTHVVQFAYRPLRLWRRPQR